MYNVFLKVEKEHRRELVKKGNGQTRLGKKDRFYENDTI
jgi:hypothetical protein